MRFVFKMKTQGAKVISAINESYAPVLMKRDALIPFLVSAFSMRLDIFQVGEDFGFSELWEIAVSKTSIFKKFLTRLNLQKGSETIE